MDGWTDGRTDGRTTLIIPERKLGYFSSKTAVFTTFSCSWFTLHHSTKLLTRFLYSSSPPALYTPHNGHVSREFLQMTRLTAVLEICSVGGEEEGRQHSSLRGADVVDQTVRHTVL